MGMGMMREGSHFGVMARAAKNGMMGKLTGKGGICSIMGVPTGKGGNYCMSVGRGGQQVVGMGSCGQGGMDMGEGRHSSTSKGHWLW